jgi:hypothetical protein
LPSSSRISLAADRRASCSASGMGLEGCERAAERPGSTRRAPCGIQTPISRSRPRPPHHTRRYVLRDKWPAGAGRRIVSSGCARDSGAHRRGLAPARRQFRKRSWTDPRRWSYALSRTPPFGSCANDSVRHWHYDAAHVTGGVHLILPADSRPRFRSGALAAERPSVRQL